MVFGAARSGSATDATRKRHTNVRTVPNTSTPPVRSKGPLLIIGLIVAATIAGFVGFRLLDRHVASVTVDLIPGAIPADGVSSAMLEIGVISRFGNRLNASALPYAPRVEITEGASLVRLVPLGDSLRYRLVAGFDRGQVTIRVRVAGYPAPFEEILLLTPSLADRNANGYPDAVDLTSAGDRSAFRRWFVAIALGQLTHLDDGWQDRDCAGLLRYCFREALKRHDNRWLRSRRWLVSAAIPDVAKYNYPAVPLVGSRVFNAGNGAIDRALDVTAATAATEDRDGGSDGGMRTAQAGRGASNTDATRRDGRVDLDAFATFAEASRLKDNSMVFLSRDPSRAIAGDVLFYLNDTRSAWPYHTMVYVGNGVTVYHTGPDGDDPGIVKRMTLAQLAGHPNPRWHPVASNPYFLGFYRWRILV